MKPGEFYWLNRLTESKWSTHWQNMIVEIVKLDKFYPTRAYVCDITRKRFAYVCIEDLFELSEQQHAEVLAQILTMEYREFELIQNIYLNLTLD